MSKNHPTSSATSDASSPTPGPGRAFEIVDSENEALTVADGRATMYVMVGLPAAGKTTLARRLEIEHRALRFTPDEWMNPLFGESMADGKRNVLEGRLIATALSALRLGFNVVPDFGVWAKDERTALRWLASTARADCKLVYSPIDETEQRDRVTRRFATDPESTFPMTDADLAEFRMIFQTPDEDELNGGTLDPPPSGFDSTHTFLIRERRTAANALSESLYRANVRVGGPARIKSAATRTLLSISTCTCA
jgi:predicted kinase